MGARRVSLHEHRQRRFLFDRLARDGQHPMACAQDKGTAARGVDKRGRSFARRRREIGLSGIREVGRQVKARVVLEIKRRADFELVRVCKP